MVFSRTKFKISHYFFADGIVLFARAERKTTTIDNVILRIDCQLGNSYTNKKIIQSPYVFSTMVFLRMQNLACNETMLIDNPWQSIFSFTCWSIWLHRNRKTFQTESNDIIEHFDIFIRVIEFHKYMEKSTLLDKRITILAEWNLPQDIL